MNAIQELERSLRVALPGATISLDSPSKDVGDWFLDISYRGWHATVQWVAGRGFGVVSDPSHGYGERSDEVYADVEAVLLRICYLIYRRGRTIPPRAVRLRELREEQGISQEEMAKRLRIRQGSVSKAEARGDFHVSTLEAFAKALGCSLVVKFVFPDQTERILSFSGAS